MPARIAAVQRAVAASAADITTQNSNTSDEFTMTAATLLFPARVRMTKAPRPERRHYFLEERHHLTKEQQAVVAKIFTGAVARCQLSMIGARSSEERAFYVSHTAEAEQLAEIFKAREAVNIEDDDQEELVDENRDCHPTRQ